MTDDQLVTAAVRGFSTPTRVPGGQALGLYERLRVAGELARHLIVEYRCADPAGCLLARVFTTRAGTFVHKPAHHSTGAGGGSLSRYRPESAYMLPSFPMALPLGCDHLHTRWDAGELRADIALAHRRGSPTGRRIRAPRTSATGLPAVDPDADVARRER